MLPVQERFGLKVYWGMEHRSADGTLISRQALIEPPKPLTCMKLGCLRRYFIRCLRYSLVLKYHQNRAAYAEKWSKSGKGERYKVINEKYRTGEGAPIGFRELIWENIKIRILLWLN